jgi:hypothetical protein
MEAVPRKEPSKSLESSSTITIWTCRLQGTSIWLQIGAMVFYYPTTLGRFENIGINWSLLLYSMETVPKVEASNHPYPPPQLPYR